MSALKLIALEKVPLIFVVSEVFQFRGVLNTDAFSKVPCKVVTFSVFQSKGELNPCVSLNAVSRDVTVSVFHPSRDPEKIVAPLNASLKLVADICGLFVAVIILFILFPPKLFAP